MRAIGSLQSEFPAKTFSDYLYVQGIDNQVEPEPDGTWMIWVHDEEQLDQGKALLTEFRSNPNDPKYGKEGIQAELLREEAAEKDRAYAARVQTRATLFRRLATYGMGPVTFFVIVLCTIVFLWTKYGGDRDKVAPLMVSEQLPAGDSLEDRFAGMTEVRDGQFWRLLTPIFLHFGFMHIIFNMLCFRDLGSMIEARFSGTYLCVLMLVLALLSNVAQFLFGFPMFGGMSGVVYGLFGFIWMRGRFDPGSQMFLHPTTVTMMIVWFFLCFTGAVGSIANVTHTAGLLTGMFWGWLPTAVRNR